GGGHRLRLPLRPGRRPRPAGPLQPRRRRHRPPGSRDRRRPVHLHQPQHRGRGTMKMEEEVSRKDAKIAKEEKKAGRVKTTELLLFFVNVLLPLRSLRLCEKPSSWRIYSWQT